MHIPRFTTVFLPLVWSCGGQITGEKAQVDAADPEDRVASPIAPCDAVARVLSPVSAGASDFYFLDDVIFEVNNGADEATISILAEDSSPIPGTTWVDPLIETEGWQRVVFTPEHPLDPIADYTAQLDYCGGIVGIDFSTSSLGTPLDSPESLAGATFGIDLSAARIARPSSVAQVLLTLLDHDLMVQVTELTDEFLSMRMGARDKQVGTQDTCMPTVSIDMEGAMTSAPTFDLGPVDVEFSLVGYTVTLFDTTAEATFAQDAQSFAGGRLTGVLDARDVVLALAGQDVLPWENPELLCERIGEMGMPCTTCNDGEPLCLEVSIRNVNGERIERSVEDVTDFDCHAGCAASCDNEECEMADEFAVCDPA